MPNWTFSRVVTLGRFLRCCFHTCITEKILLLLLSSRGLWLSSETMNVRLLCKMKMLYAGVIALAEEKKGALGEEVGRVRVLETERPVFCSSSAPSLSFVATEKSVNLSWTQFPQMCKWI